MSEHHVLFSHSNISSCDSPTESGILLIELAMVIVLIAFLLFGSLELSHYLRFKQVTQSLNRESASLAYRDCSTKSGTDALFCLRHVRTTMLTKTALLLPGKEIVLSLYRAGPGGTILLEVQEPAAPAFASLFSVASLSVPSDQTGTVVRNQGVAVISELRTNFLPLTGGAFQIGLSAFVYDAAIL